MNYYQQPQKQNEDNTLTFGKKIKYSFYSTMIFFFISSPALYQLMQNAFGSNFPMSDDNGCPNNKWLLVHTGLFFIIILIAMSLG
jgi:hypothetical protein